MRDGQSEDEGFHWSGGPGADGAEPAAGWRLSEEAVSRV